MLVRKAATYVTVTVAVALAIQHEKTRQLLLCFLYRALVSSKHATVAPYTHGIGVFFCLKGRPAGGGGQPTVTTITRLFLTLMGGGGGAVLRCVLLPYLVQLRSNGLRNRDRFGSGQRNRVREKRASCVSPSFHLYAPSMIPACGCFE